VLELACGKGEYSNSLAAVYHHKNFIGIDVKGDRLAVACQNADSRNLKNVAFLRANILQILDFFEENEVQEIWITFPDPRTRVRDARRRLTHKRFLEMYRTILSHNGLLYLKTDNRPFFDFSLEQLNDFTISDLKYTYNLYESDLRDVAHHIKTRFEEIFTAKGFDINFLSCRIKKGDY
jgi:tRNA (guanine-N7-)-methyltransferase